jgi:hypothetical protein
MNLPFDVCCDTYHLDPLQKELVMKIGRPRIHKSNALRQKAYRLRLAERRYTRAKATLRRAQNGSLPS